MIKNKKGLRIARPLGLTSHISHIHNNTNKETKDNLLTRIKIQLIQQWTNSNMYLNNKLYTIDQLTKYLNTDIGTINKYQYKAMREAGRYLNKAEAGEIARVLFCRALNLSLEIQSETALQLGVLKASQGGKYKAFISSTVNQAIANHQNSTKPFLDLIKMLQPAGDTNYIFNANVNNDNRSITNFNQEMALKTINENLPSMLMDPHLADEQVEKYKKANLLPDVNARTQDLRGIGIKHNGTPPIINSLPTGTSHEDRREVSEGIQDIESVEDFNA